MNTKRRNVAACTLVTLILSLFLSACGPEQLFGPTPTPTPTITSTPTPTLTPTWTPDPTMTVKPTATVPAADQTYAALLEQVKLADPKFDFTALRMSYTETTAYDPYNFGLGETRKAMLAVLNDKDYGLTIKLAEQILKDTYILPDAHLASVYAYQGLGQTQESDFHRYVLDGLLHSILSSGDGKSEKSAYIVVLIQEEYAILGTLGIKDYTQSFKEAGGHSYDIFEGVDGKTNAPVTLYFNIDKLYQSLENSLKP